MPSALDSALPAGLAATISRDPLPADAGPGAEDDLLDDGLLDPVDDNPVTPLYRLALGPVNPQHYLSIFERLDATGRTLPHWNWAAGLLTFNWMVFRRMWVAALGYVVVLEIALLLILGVGRYTLDWPTSVVAPMLLLLGLIAVMVPGLYGDAMLHADLRKRIARAFENAGTASEARSMLQAQASTPRRIKVLAAINLVLVAVLAIAFLPLLLGASTPLNIQPAVTVADASMAAAASASTESNARAAAAADAGAASTPATDTAMGATASAADTTAAPNALAQAEPVASTAPLSLTHATEGAGAVAAGAVAASARTASPAPETAPPAASPAPNRKEREAARKALAAEKAALKAAKKAERQAAAKAARDAAKADQAKKSTERAERKATQAASKSARLPVSTPAVTPSKRKADQGTPPAATRNRPAPSTAAAAAQIPVGTLPGYYIDAGLFSDEANARKAQAALLNEGLPAFRQTVSTARGKMVRVRVGPYASRARSQPAVAAIRAQGMEASVIRKQ